MINNSANTHRALTSADLADDNHPLSGLLKAPTKPIKYLGPGAFAVKEPAQAHLILDPGINLVVVRRPEWCRENIERISRALCHVSDLAEIVRTHSTWNSTEPDDSRLIPLRVAHHFGVTATEVISQSGFALMFNDISEQIQLLKSISGAHKFFFNSRFIINAPDITEPLKHVDDQFLTMSCTYLGGGTVCELAPGTQLQLAPGEIGIWKGKIGKKHDQIIEDPDNEGQPLVHWTPLHPSNYPRFVSLIDAYDDTPPKKLVNLNSLAPWEAAKE